jgi:gluconate kinase
MLLILFGLPGAGKTFAGQLLRDRFGFFFHEADDDIPEDYKRAVAAGQVVDDERRDAYHRHLLDRLTKLHAAHPRLAVAVPLLRDRHRRWIQERFPESIFILVQCDPARWQSRLDNRRTHTVTLDYAQKIISLYEPPTIPHTILDDTAEGPADIERQLAALLDQLRND